MQVGQETEGWEEAQNQASGLDLVMGFVDMLLELASDLSARLFGCPGSGAARRWGAMLGPKPPTQKLELTDFGERISLRAGKLLVVKDEAHPPTRRTTNGTRSFGGSTQKPH
jgi:hypothetical protein